MLETKEACEKCEAELGPGADARICSYECTFCAPCTDEMEGLCPNCGGGLVTRPTRA